MTVWCWRIETLKLDIQNSDLKFANSGSTREPFSGRAQPLENVLWALWLRAAEKPHNACLSHACARPHLSSRICCQDLIVTHQAFSPNSKPEPFDNHPDWTRDYQKPGNFEGPELKETTLQLQKRQLATSFPPTLEACWKCVIALEKPNLCSGPYCV